MKVALVQMDVVHGRPEINKRTVLRFLEEAVLEKPDVIVLPEMWNTGYDLEHLADLADENGRDSLDFLSSFAKKHAVNLLAGSIANKKSDGYYNTSFAIDREGNLLSSYDKVHLFGLMSEADYLQAGQSESHFSFDGRACSAAICYDIRFPEWIRTLMSRGSQLLFVVAQWPEARQEQWEILLRARAVENQAYLVAVNRVGQSPDNVFSGHSMVVDPLGRLVLQAPDHQEGVFYCNLDFELVSQVRGQIPVFDDRRPELYR
ncbi:carbon-nitrogen family hydrolase [Streptococcus loxodontisalivarius]|uniref:Amidohydrolase n=1 Tax=Streptococcus loxodontisalivarius TaxID=1349415 RepID=A0ABS2PSM1_9STRE|nr:carbon-nitrogen family hydrolase [Streptococcus loxodontisalivarius]MBM7643038.1 putative amidohydrolase [Streptococcus loxodontisalivarius]